MRVLIVSDVHANWEALQAAAAEPHDMVVFLGDAVDFGPEPRACVDWLRAHAAIGVRGNHDHGTGFSESCRAYGTWRAWDEATHAHTLRALGDEQRDFLRSLPLARQVTFGGARWHLVHAAPSDPLYRYLPPDASDKILAAELDQADAEVLLVGHTHLPMVRRVGTRLVVNPGSVGMPREGGPGACYAVWEDGRFELRRVAYDVETTIRRLGDLGVPEDVVGGIAGVLRGG